MNKEIILYLFFGILTTIINFIVYLVTLKISGIYILSTTLAFILAIVFAYITNKKYVFKKVTVSFKELIEEFMKFLSSRIFTYIVDVLGMILLIEYFSQGEVISKLIINVIVVFLNYILSKIYIFRGKKLKD